MADRNKNNAKKNDSYKNKRDDRYKQSSSFKNTSLENSEEEDGCGLIYGRNPVMEALRSGRTPDKIFVASCMLIAVEYRLMPSWIAIAVLAREFMVTGLRSLAAKKGVVISADKFGKLKTAMQMLMLALAGASWIGCFDLWTKYTPQWYIWIIYLCGVVFVTMYSGLSYFVKFRYVFMESK